MDGQAKKIAEGLSGSDDEITDAVSERGDVRGARITHTFALDNDAPIPIFTRGVVRRTYDPSTGDVVEEVSATL
jgi:hypothetical protein